MIKKAHILSSPKLVNKFCRRRNNEINCRSILRCWEDSTSCPVKHLIEIEHGMNLKNLPFGEAYRLAERESYSKEQGKRIIKEALREVRDGI